MIQVIRITLSVLLIVLVGVACSASDYKFRGAALDEKTSDGQPINRLSINNPSFSPNGRYIAFDFHEFAIVNRRFVRSRLFIGLYDLQDQAVQILKPPLDHEIGFSWHSPSFDPTGSKLTMVTICITKGCSEDVFGTQIGVLDLAKDQFTWVTNARQKTYNWNYSTTRGRTRTSWPKYGRSVVRGYPVFSADGEGIYHVMSGGGKGSIFWQQFDAEYWLNYISLDGPKDLKVSKDQSVLDYFDDAVLFKGDGRLSRAGNNRLIFSGVRALGPSTDELDARRTSAFFYDITGEELSVAFDKNNTPIDPSLPLDRQHRLRSISASEDGSRIVALGGKKNVIFLRDEGRFQQLLTASDLGISRIGQISISSDGRLVAILPPQTPIRSDDTAASLENFWLLDLDTGALKSLPLKNPFREAISLAQIKTSWP